MKITNDNILNSVVNSKYDTAVSDMSKSLVQLKSGDTFSGTVTDIKQNSVSLKLDDNSIINAKSSGNTELRIGERASFTVKETNSGQIFVEISKTEEGIADFAKELLNNADMPATKENIDLIKSLIQNNMPVDKQTITDGLALKFLDEVNTQENVAGSDTNNTVNTSNTANTLDKVMFLLKEEMPVGKVTVETLNRLLDEQTNLKSEFLNVAEKISKMPDGELKNKLLDILEVDRNNLNSSKDVFKAISQKLSFNENDLKSHENISDKFEKIFEVAQKSSDVISQMAEDNQNNDIKQSFENIKNDLSFMKEIDNYKNYIQIPININGRDAECDLHIFKNKKGNKNFSKRASVLLSLDYFYVGKIDAFIDKIDRGLDFQFKCEKVETINIIKKNINQLSNMLGNYGFKINSVSYKEKDETFNVIKNKEGQGESTPSRRYSFDMRV